MSARKRKHGPMLLVTLMLGLVCAAVLGAIFYGTMVYQLLPDDAAQTMEPAQDYGTPPPMTDGMDAAQAFPGPLLAPAQGTLRERRAQDMEMGGETCRVVTAVYDADGDVIEAVSAWPAAYIGRLAAEGWQAQLIAGCELAQLDAVYAEREGRGMLAAREGERVYLLIGPADEQRMYALGAACALE